MPADLRRHFEPRFGRTLSAVRVHTDAAAGAEARALGARAFALGQDIGFAPGAWRPDTPDGRRLIGHEIAHTLQQAAGAPRLQLQDAPDAEPQEEPQEEGQEELQEEPQERQPLSVSAAATVGIVGRSRDVTGNLVEADTPFYHGDVIRILVHRSGVDVPNGGLAVTLPPGDLDLVDQANGTVAWLRVIAPPETIGDGRIVDVVLESPALDEPLTLRLKLAPAPAEPDVAPPDFREERIAVRQAIKETKAEIRDLPPEQADRRARLEPVLVSLEHQREALEIASEAWDDLPCSGARLEMIQEGLALASERVARAVARLEGDWEADPAVVAALSRYLRIDSGAEAAEARRSAVRQVIDVLNVARNGMLTAEPDQFRCVEDQYKDCKKPGRGAFVTRPGPRGGRVNVCTRLFAANLPANAGMADQSELRAMSLLHEFVHLAGISATEARVPAGRDEVRVVEAEEWANLTPAQAAAMADAYAVLAFVLG